MRRILLAFLICLLPLQSFAGLVMNAKMAVMDAVVATANTTQAPCHEASQPMASDNQDCCGSQAMCQAICHLVASVPAQAFSFGSITLKSVQITPNTQFVSATVHAPQKPPIS